MIKCPIDFFQDNLIFNQDKSCWAVFKLNGYDYDFLSTESKISVLYKMARMLSGVMSEAQVLIIPVVQDMKQHFMNLKQHLNKNDVLYQTALDQLDKTYDYLKSTVQENGAVNDYRTYLVIKLQDSAEFESILRIKEMYEFFVKDPKNAIEVLMNTDTKDILKTKVDKYMRMSDRWFFKQNQRIRMQKADGAEIQWLIRRMAYRGLNKLVKLFYSNPKTEEPWKPKSRMKRVGREIVVKPNKKDIVRLFSGAIRSRNRILSVDTDCGRSYQTFLAITKLPDVFEYPDTEWIYMLQQYNVQAEICLHIKVTEHRDGVRKLELKRREFNSQLEHIGEANADIPEDLLEGKEYLDVMEQELKSSKAPLLNTSITICLASNNKSELENKVSKIRNAYEDMNFGIERPVSDQLDLYCQFIPSVGQIVRDFVMPLTPITLASGVIGASHQLGDDVGPYIGTTGIEEKQVFLDIGRACLLNKSASAIFLGNLGVGKSFNTNLLIYLTVIFGGYGLIFDPKGERSHWKDELHVLDGLITTVTLSSSPEFAGKLDPYNVYREDLDLANELAINMLTELFEIKSTSNEYVAILEAVKHIEEGKGSPSMLKLAEKLDSFNTQDELYGEAKMLARKIRLQKEAGMARLLFGDGTEEAISLENRLNILQIQNLKLPSPTAKKEDYSAEEKLSTVLMMVLSHFAKKFALVKRPVFKICLFDESWMLGKTQEGVKLYDFLTRMGRSLFTGCIFNSHSVLDIPTEGIKNTLSYKFCFQTTNENEANRMIEFLGLENTPELHETLKNLGNGQCLFQDLDGHVGVLQFDAVFQDIIDVFSTTPTTDTDEEDEKQNMIEQEVTLEESVKNMEESVSGTQEDLDELAKLFEEPDIKKIEEEMQQPENIDIYEREVI